MIVFPRLPPFADCRRALALMLFAVAGCAVPLDPDGDGVPAELGDCDDQDPAVVPGAADGCDGRDNDCDGAIDEDQPALWYPDGDGDGFGVPGEVRIGCQKPAGYAATADDCDDATAGRNPGAAETCDGADQNCDGGIDEDGDGDGLAPCARGALPADCDDGRADVYPGAVESWDDTVDNDCDGVASADHYVSVDGDFPPPFESAFRSIQAAIDAARDGEVVLVGPGTYDERLTFQGKTVKVVSEAGPEQTVIDANGVGSVALFLGGEEEPSMLKGFTLTGGVGTDPALCGNGVSPRSEPNGGGVCIRDASPRLSSLIVHGNRAHDGGGIQMNASLARLEDILLYENEATDDGGGLHCYAAAPTLSRITSRDNRADTYGGGIALFNSTPSIMQDITVTGNRAAQGGGISMTFDAGPRVERFVVTGNQADQDGGGVYLGEDCAPTLVNGVIDGNQALSGEGRGGGLVLDDAPATLRNVMVRGNRSGYRGGGMSLNWDSRPVLVNVVVAGNSATEGGGMFVYNSVPDLDHLVVAGNSAGVGGGIYLYFSGVSLADSILAFNRAGQLGENLFNNDSGRSITLGYNLFYSSGGGAGTSGLAPGSTDRVVDPGFRDAPAGGSWEGADYRLGSGSPGIDGGSATGVDPDGSRADVGAWGGEGADGWDLDADGWPAEWRPYDPQTGESDCDDGDPAVPADADCPD